MGSSFGSLEIAKTGLFVSRKALDVTGHNITNADTVGYTRQRLSVQALDPASAEGRYLTVAGSAVGRGVEATTVDQIRNDFLDRQYRSETSDFGKWSTRTEELEYIETLLNEGTENNISLSLADFFDSINELSLDPMSEEIRTNMQQNAIKLTETFNHYYNNLVDQQDLYNSSMDVVVTEINDYLTSIADYNKQIYSYELSGLKANDLRDKRNVLLDELSETVNIEYYENSDKQLTVTVEGATLIDHIDATLLETRPELTGAVSGQTGYYEIYLEGTATVFDYSSGKLQAYKDLRDGNSDDNIGIPKMLNELNILARSLTQEFNAANNAGYTMPYGANPSQTGVDLFEVPVGGIADVNAGNFSISAALEDSVYNIAASDQLVDPTAASSQMGNNVNILAMVDLTTSNSIPTVSNFDSYMQSLVVEIAIESAHSNKMSDSQSAIVDNIENRRQSISGVSVDEEMIEMVKHQHAYAAASRMINTIDEALDILINKTGLVGR